MGVLGKLMFWKKEPRLDIDTGIDTSFPPVPSPGFGQPSFGAPRLGDPGLDNQSFGSPSYGQSQPGLGLDTPPFPSQPGYDQPKILSETSPGFSPNVQRDTYDKNLEIVSMKLDNIKAAIENMNQRLINIERIAMDSMREDQQRRRPNW
jgi:hypothetical protein